MGSIKKDSAPDKMDAFKASLIDRHKNIVNNYSQVNSSIVEAEKQLSELKEAKQKLTGIIEYNASILQELEVPEESIEVPEEDVAEAPSKKKTKN